MLGMRVRAFSFRSAPYHTFPPHSLLLSARTISYVHSSRLCFLRTSGVQETWSGASADVGRLIKNLRNSLNSYQQQPSNAFFFEAL